MNEMAVRELVRNAVARHLAREAHAPDAESYRSARPHASHALYMQLVNTSDACVIEPTLSCNHCGYCKSHGH